MIQQIEFNWQPDYLQNDTVVLKPIEEYDFEALFSVASNPEIWEQHPEPDRYKREVFQIYFNSAIKSRSAFLILEKKSGKIIGSTRYYEFNLMSSSIAIGYTFLAKEYWGGKFNKAVKQLMLDYAFQQVNKIFFHIGANNIRSQTAIQRLGAKKVREYTKQNKGITENHIEYLLEKKEWIK